MHPHLSGNPNQEFKLKETAIAIKKKQVEQEVHRQLELAHQNASTYGANKKILQEEEYVSSLERIIERDFFPDLKKLQMNEEWLLARKNDDHEKMRAIQQRYKNSNELENSMNRIETPNFKDTPLATPSGYIINDEGHFLPNEIDPIKEITKGNNLTSFFKKYVNEDDVSFSKIIGDEKLEHRKRFWWKNLNKEQNQLQIESGDQMKAIGWAEPGENVLIFNPKGFKAPELVNPPLMSTNNTRFQYDPHEHVNEMKEEEQSKEMELLKLLTKQQNSKNRNQPVNHKQKSDKIDLDDLYGGQQKQISSTSINGFELIQQEELTTREEDEKKIPLLLDKNINLGKNGTSRNPFLIPETPTRQQVGIALANNAQKNISKRNQVLSKNHSNSTSLQNTPKSEAAKKIAAQMSQRSMLNSDPQLRSSYSPSPRRRDGPIIQTPTNTNLKRRNSTPTPSSFNQSNSTKDYMENIKKKQKTISTPTTPVGNSNNKSKHYSSLTDGLL